MQPAYKNKWATRIRTAWIRIALWNAKGRFRKDLERLTGGNAVRLQHHGHFFEGRFMYLRYAALIDSEYAANFFHGHFVRVVEHHDLLITFGGNFFIASPRTLRSCSRAQIESGSALRLAREIRSGSGSRHDLRTTGCVGRRDPRTNRRPIGAPTVPAREERE